MVLDLACLLLRAMSGEVSGWGSRAECQQTVLQMHTGAGMTFADRCLSVCSMELSLFSSVMVFGLGQQSGGISTSGMLLFARKLGLLLQALQISYQRVKKQL